MHCSSSSSLENRFSDSLSAMAATTGEGRKQQFASAADGNKYPSSFKAPPKPSLSDGVNHSVINVSPLLDKEEDTSLVQDVCTISVLPDEGNTIPQCTSQFTLFSFVKALLPSSKNQMFIDAQLNCQKTQNRINVLLGGTDSYQSCVVDINVEKGNGGVEAHDGGGGVLANVKSETSVHMQKVLQRQASTTTDKAISERCHDAPTNRWRRYKRAASFDSRKIVILFSILSSVGTLILIYLTLRVRQSGDNSFNHM